MKFLPALLLLPAMVPAIAGQVPGPSASADIAISHRDRFYTSDQFSNTVSVIDPADNKLLGVLRLGDPTPGNLSPLYKGQVLVHGMGFSPDNRTLAVVSIGSNSVTLSIPRPTRSNTSPMWGAPRMRPSLHQTAKRSG
jgi:DNA-binding beta-propeller fold protein YncE